MFSIAVLRVFGLNDLLKFIKDCFSRVIAKLINFLLFNLLCGNLIKAEINYCETSGSFAMLLLLKISATVLY